MGFGFLSLVFVLTLFFRSLTCQQPNTDGFFVFVFFQKMGLVSSHGYNFSSPVCSWQLVFCDAKQENVIGLVAPNLGLSGSIPETTIGKLKKLQSLDLSNNLITALPSYFWSLSSLKTLNLSNNRIIMNLPTNLGNFNLLEKLDLSSNNFTGPIPDSISALVGLQVLNLNHNGFIGIPLGILKCHSLVSIDLCENILSGTLSDGFGSAFPKLKYLNLAENQIHGRDLSFSGMVSINHLNISGNLFKGSVVDIFQGPLEVIDVSRNLFEGHISQVNFSSRFNWSHLVYLDLSRNQLSGDFSDSLNKAQNLKHLNLAENRFSKQKFLKVDSLLGLEYLNLSITNLIGSIPNEISLLTNLRILDLSNNHLTSKIPLSSIQKLKSLDLSINNLVGAVPMSILKKLPWMERFNFSLNNLTLCDSQLSSETLRSAFIGSSYSCPIAVNPGLSNKKTHNHRGLKLALALTLSLLCLLIGLLLLAFCCRKKTQLWAVKPTSYKEEENISGPFSFQTDSTTWVANVKQATSIPVIIFEKPLLKYTFADLLSATSNFDKGTFLAEGRFGPVYRGILPGGIHVTVKILVHGSTMTDQEAVRELECLGQIKHPNLVSLTGYCLAGEQRIAIYEYMENGNLQNLLHDLPLGVQTTEDWSTDKWEEESDENSNGIQHVGTERMFTTWRFRYKIALGTARALAYLHHGCSPPIIHRDVKASNVYLDFSLEPRLSDYGLAKIFGDNCGSHDYMPPEFLQQDTGFPRTVTPKFDIYGFGVVLLELITGKKPIDDDYLDGISKDSKEVKLVSWVRGLVRKSQGSRAIDLKICGTGLESQMEEALKIGYLCTAEDPLKRPSMQQVVGILKDIEPIASQ